MIASNVTREVLVRAAEAVGVRAEIKPLSGSGRRFRVKLYPVVGPELRTSSGRRRGDAKYQRTSACVQREGRRVHAVCWHGFRDYFRAVFKAAPDAVFRTMTDTWRGAADFEARYRASGARHVGSRMATVCAAEVCRCGEEGMAV